MKVNTLLFKATNFQTVIGKKVCSSLELNLNFLPTTRQAQPQKSSQTKYSFFSHDNYSNTCKQHPYQLLSLSLGCFPFLEQSTFHCSLYKSSMNPCGIRLEDLNFQVLNLGGQQIILECFIGMEAVIPNFKICIKIKCMSMCIILDTT